MAIRALLRYIPKPDKPYKPVIEEQFLALHKSFQYGKTGDKL